MVNDKTNTPDEIIDLLDDQDNVIGKTTKGEANANPKLIHREIAIIIYDKEGRILFQQRSRNKKVDPLLWDLSVAGHIPSGISIEEGAHRELKEELGFDIPLTFLTKILRKYDNETHFTNYFKGQYNGSKIVVEEAEVEQTQFMSRDEFRKALANGMRIGETASEMAEYFWKTELKN